MSELIVVGYREPRRASQVLDTLRAALPVLDADLDNAAVVRCYADGELRVQFSIDPTSGIGVCWSGLWGALLSLALFLPLADEVTAAAQAATGGGLCAEGDYPATPGVYPREQWWLDTLALPANFIRDLGALVRPGTSVLLLLLRGDEQERVADQLPGHGGAQLHLQLSQRQDDELTAILHHAARRGRVQLAPVPEGTFAPW